MRKMKQKRCNKKLTKLKISIFLKRIKEGKIWKEFNLNYQLMWHHEISLKTHLIFDWNFIPYFQSIVILITFYAFSILISNIWWEEEENVKIFIFLPCNFPFFSRMNNSTKNPQLKFSTFIAGAKRFTFSFILWQKEKWKCHCSSFSDCLKYRFQMRKNAEIFYTKMLYVP